MHDRSVLGAADVTDEQLRFMVADLLHTDPADTTLLGSSATEFPYDLPAITTAGRYQVSGRARVGTTELAFRFFVKHVQSWSRHPFFEQVPPEHRATAAAGVPWRTEGLAYRSDLGDRLPEGLTMPRSVGVFDIDAESNAVWLEDVPVVTAEWGLNRYTRAAHLLGRLAVSGRVEELRDVGQREWTLRTYHDGRLALQVLPMLRDDGIWHHPLVARAFDDELRARLQQAATQAEAFTDELSAIPVVTAHGDACPSNLLTQEGSDNFVLIDYGFWGPNPVGFDLGQLLVGDVQVGRRTSADLEDLDAAIVDAYVTGLRAEGCAISEDVVRRAHALQLLLFSGLSTLPVEHVESDRTPELDHLAEGRAAISRLSLDLVDATG